MENRKITTEKHINRGEKLENFQRIGFNIKINE